jgi:predicted dehydrogenase
VGDEFAIPRRTATFDEVLRMDDVGIVDICTPPSLHVPQALAALAAGKEVVCEKPLAGSLADVDRLIAAERAATTRIMPVFQYRFGNGLQKARRIVERGLAGKPYLATVETAWKRGAKYYSAPRRGRWDTELGGVLLTHAIHSHDIMTYLMGPIASVFARTATRVNPIEVEDCAVASLAMASGALVSLAPRSARRPKSAGCGSASRMSPSRARWRAIRGGDDPWQIVPASPEVEGRIADALRDWRFVPSRFEGLMARYHAALAAGSEFPVTLADARRSLELVTALLYSAETGAAVSLPIGAAHPRYGGWRPHASFGGAQA